MKSVKVASLLLVGLTVALAVGNTSAESKKVVTNGRVVGLQSQTIYFPGDDPAHQVVSGVRYDVLMSSDPDWNNLRCPTIFVTDYIAGSGVHRGYQQQPHPNGDLSVTQFEGTTKRTTNADGSWTAEFSGKFRYVGGTGKYRGMSGTGTYSGKGSAPNATAPPTVTYETTGEYELKP